MFFKEITFSPEELIMYMKHLNLEITDIAMSFFLNK